MLKKLTKKFYFISVAAIVCLLAVSGVVLADTIINHYYGEATISQAVDEGESFGGVAEVGGICNGSEPTTQMCNVNTYELQIQTDLTIDDDLIVSGEDITLNTLNAKVKTGSCADATTTPIAIASPFTSGTSTVVGLYITQANTATTTVSWDCGVATNAFTSSDTLLDGQSVATTTWGNLSHDTGTNGRATDIHGSSEYVTCTITPEISGAITEATNAFTCTYKAEFKQ